MLTLDRAQRARRALAAAAANLDAGDFEGAMDLLAIAEVGPLGELENARLDVVQAQLAFVTSRGSDAPPLLMKAAKRLEPIDVNLSRDTYLDAFAATMFAGRLAVGGSAWDVARHAGAAPHAPQEPRPSDLLLDGFAMHYNEGYAAGVPILRRALSAFGAGMSADEELRWLWLACIAALHTWDHERWDELSDRHVRLAREVGALSELPLALSSRAYVLLFAGDLSGAAALVEELHAVKQMTGSRLAPYVDLGLAAFRGSSAEVSALAETTLADATIRGEGNAISSVEWARAVLNNGLGEYGKAMAAAERSGSYSADVGAAVRSPVELVEAAMRSGMRDVAVGAHRRVNEIAIASGTDWIVDWRRARTR